MPALTRRLGTPLVALIGIDLMVIATAWLSRLSADTDYLTGIAIPIPFYGAAQGLTLSSLTTAGMAGVEPEEASAAGGLVNVSHHLGGALSLGILTTVFATAHLSGAGPRELLAHRVGATFTGGVVLTLIALIVTGFVARGARANAPRRRKPAKTCVATLDEPARL